MNWEVERDNSGRAVRMWWLGSGGRPRNKDLAKPGQAPCPGCGYLFGWHTPACTVRHPSIKSVQP